MKKLFGHKPKNASKAEDAAPRTPQPAIPTPLYQKLATHGGHIGQPHLQQSTNHVPFPNDEPSWDIIQQQAPQDLPNPHSAPLIAPTNRSPSYASLTTPVPPRSASPMPNQPPTNHSNSHLNREILAPPPQPTNKLVRHHDREREAYLQQSNNRRKQQHQPPPAALGILRALEPPRGDSPAPPPQMTRSLSEDHERYAASESGHSLLENPTKDKKRGFWGSSNKDKEREREREREYERERERQREQERLYRERERLAQAQDFRDRDRGREVVRRDDESSQELTRMIGYLTATASEDWALVLDVCARASDNEASAKEAVRALRREFKYGEPAAQLSAARLWAIMLRNSSDLFISQSTSRKFLDTLEDLLISSRTSPVVRERLLEVVAAAAYASGSKKDGRHEQGFKGLWKRVKPHDKPEEGVPFDTDDAMFQPPSSGRASAHDIPIVSYQEASPLPLESNPATPTPTTIKKRKSPTRNRIIPPDEDMRRLFQECKIGAGNADVLASALVTAKPGDLKKDPLIKEFYSKCRASQELIYAQIPWATAIAERSRALREQDGHRPRTLSDANKVNSLTVIPDPPTAEEDLTIEEKLLNALLAANADLLESLKQWEDLNRLAIEKKVQDRSRKELRMDRRQQQDNNGLTVHEGQYAPGGSTSRTPSPPPSRSHSPHHYPHHQYSQHGHSHSQRPSVDARPQHLNLSDSSDPELGSVQSLAPPPAAPHGPRSPALYSARSRTPSPTPGPREGGFSINGGSMYAESVVQDETRSLSSVNGYGSVRGHRRSDSDSDDEVPYKPSAKALGKRKVVEEDVISGPPLDSDDNYYGNGHSFGAGGDGIDRDLDDDSGDSRWRPPVQFVYDAVAERTRQLQLAGSGSAGVQVNGVH